MEWLRPRVLDSWTLDPWPTDYATFAETSYTADVTVRFSPVRNNVTVDQAVHPTMEIGLARANLSEGWTVSRARSPALHVGTPVHIGISVGKFPQASIGSAFELDYFNALTGDPAELRIYVAGSDKPVFQAQTNGGGIFASGLHSGVVDMTQCTPEGNLPEGSMPLQRRLRLRRPGPRRRVRNPGHQHRVRRDDRANRLRMKPTVLHAGQAPFQKRRIDRRGRVNHEIVDDESWHSRSIRAMPHRPTP